MTDLGSVRTVANAVTLMRTVTALVIGAYAIAADRPWFLAVGYGVYWVGDIADGWCARRLGQETRLGAVFDIVSDRACTAVLCVGLLAHMPELLAVVIVFLGSFMVLDTLLSLAFLCWPLVSPNYFWQVDRGVYNLNWSPLAKVVNTAGVIGAALAGLHWFALVIAIAIVAVKCWSARRVLNLVAERTQ